ncbi:MAG: peptidylprolyl isomerase [Elusimicrobiota bacterium]
MNRKSAFLLVAALLCACAPKSEPQVKTQTPPAASAPPAPAPIPAAAVKTAAPIPGNATATAPETFKARFKTTKGEFVIEAHRSWSPHGADRFYNLVKLGYFENVACFRVVSGFMAQFGIHGDPALSAQWREAKIPDDPAIGQSNARGAISFAMAGPNTRTVQLFINYVDNRMLDGMGFTPFGRVVSGMEVVDQLHGGYGDGPPRGRGPNQGLIQTQGNDYLRRHFDGLDYILSASLE